MRPTVSQYAQALEELSQTTPSEAKTLTKNLLGLLKRRGESEKAVLILDRLERMEAEKEKRVAVVAVTAHEPSADVQALLMKKATTLFPGKKIDMTYAVDKQVMSGVRFRSEELLYDATVASELSSLKKSISK